MCTLGLSVVSVEGPCCPVGKRMAHGLQLKAMVKAHITIHATPSTLGPARGGQPSRGQEAGVGTHPVLGSHQGPAVLSKLPLWASVYPSVKWEGMTPSGIK